MMILSPCLTRSQVGRLKVLIFRRAGAGFPAEHTVEEAEILQQTLFAGWAKRQVRVGKRGFANRKARGQLLDVSGPSVQSISQGDAGAGGPDLPIPVGRRAREGGRNDLDDATGRLDVGDGVRR